MGTPLISGVQAAMVGVSDFAPHLNILCDGLGWTEIADGVLDASICQHLWGVNSSAEIKVLTTGDAPTGRIHLLRFPDLGPEAVGLPAIHTFGHHGLNMYVRDMEKMRAALLDRGARFVGEAKYSLSAQDGSSQTVHQIKMECADGVGVVFVSPETPRFTHGWDTQPEKTADVFCTELTSVVVLIPDVNASRRFWGSDGMGLVFHYDGITQSEAAAAMTGRAPDEQNHLLFGFGTETARVELSGRGQDHYAEIPRVDLTSKQRPGKGLGEIGWVLCVDALDSALAAMEQLGGTVIAQPIETSMPGYGPRRAATVQTPEGIWISVWENA